LNKPLINNQIRAREIKLIDETGKQLGIMPLLDALRISQERNLDLIQVTEKVEPPVCKIGDYGKYLYWQEKKAKGQRAHGGEIKGIRLTFNISQHDLETRVYQTEKFIKNGDKVRVEIILRGREKAHAEIAREKINYFVEFLKKLVPIKIERELKKEPRGFSMIISK